MLKPDKLFVLNGLLTLVPPKGVDCVLLLLVELLNKGKLLWLFWFVVEKVL